MTRAPIIPGSSWPAQGSQGRNNANSCKSQLRSGEKIEKVKSPPGLLIWHLDMNISRGENGRGGELQGERVTYSNAVSGFVLLPGLFNIFAVLPPWGPWSDNFSSLFVCLDV